MKLNRFILAIVVVTVAFTNTACIGGSSESETPTKTDKCALAKVQGNPGSAACKANASQMQQALNELE
jgi:hypothetical protein